VRVRERKTGRTALIVGGAVLVALLFSRGKGWGFHGAGSPSRTAARPVVWIRADRLEIDGVTADLATVLARSRTAGAVEVHATGDAITGVVSNVLDTLHEAGITIYTTSDLSSVVPSERGV